MTTNHEPLRDDETPPELRDMEQRLSFLASRDARPSSGFENRLFTATRNAIAEAPAPLHFPAPAPGRWRLAAAVTLLAGAGLVSAYFASTRIVAPIAAHQIAQGTAGGSTSDADELSDELDDLLTSYEDVRGADLASSYTQRDTFWGDDVTLPTEDPTQ